SPTDTGAPLGYRAAGIRMRALLPSTSCKTDIPEAGMPPRKKAFLTNAAPGFEIGESSAAGAARKPGPTESDLRRCRRVAELDTTVRQRTNKSEIRFEDAQYDRALLRARVNTFRYSYEVPANAAPTDTASEGTGKKKGRTVTVTADDMQKRKNNVKARTTLLLSLPDEHQLRFSKYKTTQELWAAILKTFGGNEATKKTKKNLLKQQYGNFKAKGSETLKKTFNRLQRTTRLRSNVSTSSVLADRDHSNISTSSGNISASSGNTSSVNVVC
nr:ribonuclease H-like domain-containing protein [Tanacetum cinerariifolium]